MIQDFVNTPSLNFGMMLKQISESPYRKLIFASSDHPDVSLHPRLEVSYFQSSSPLAVITASGPATIVCGSTVSLNANINTDVTYQWYRNNVPVAGAVTSSYTATQAGSYTVTLTNSCQLTVTSNPFNVTSSNYNCAVPQNVTVSNVTTTTATINWTNSSAPQYQVRYRKVGTNAFTNITLNSAPCNTSLVITGLKKNTSYFMSMRALCSTGNSAFSPEIMFTTPAVNNRYAIQETSDDESVAVFPSPVLNDLTIQIQTTSTKNVTAMLFDLTGRLIIQKQIVLQEGENEIQLETFTLQAGQYLLTVEGLETNFRQRILKQ